MSGWGGARESEAISLQKLFGNAKEIWRIGNWLQYTMPDGKRWFRWQPRPSGEQGQFQFRIS